ncbi:carbamoyltransferase HypF [Campylobacter sp. MIT 21-1685]|uniref:carbamoyltransferase HypF n=1 Tax=unclassified Campylobacter TaxID=2593542 RepID=UPI00224A9889|nr:MULTISPECIES: carbamoyltransferase HypF [unclassified Campylobacter]MCX2682275.1 carbamoyltransferase HypF [Campylobacter sp. MIT 21-1684]MCX2750555.1 carbamoyltransferase HypF [Campylobacter sp. MIT 21-1682]MCX2806897.1 carbamoyltransferase HypF [Campylobacter sp. MIT 21-1685]
MSHLGFRLEISGLVQGVGFRPFVYTVAQRLNLKGEVYNDGFGVVVLLCCGLEKCEEFIALLKADLPYLARIDSIQIHQTQTKIYDDFCITPSKYNLKSAPLLSDFGICSECKKEFYSAQDLRHLYPFITCTLCGPRFSFIRTLPYDRKNTSMDKFIMCEFCKSEFENPSSRRFHAQPISCPKCEIHTYLKDVTGTILASSTEAFKKTAEFLRQGKIIAIKGMGGFHLMCDAFNSKAVSELRLRKNRPLKPFALMCPHLKSAQELACINETEADLLQSQLAPIVLLQAKKSFPLLAPHMNKIGIMLAYTPFHLLLFEYFQGVLVATSANLSGESIIYKEQDLCEKLCGVFDFYLSYEREILHSSDDSIAQVVGTQTMFLRTSRGLNPCYIDLKDKIDTSINVLALGSELKNQFALLFHNKLLLSPYIGNMKSVDVNERFFTLLEFFQRTYELDFEVLLCDKHPHFFYTKQNKAKRKYAISHHYAHFCAALFEYGITEKALGFIFDGTGYGDDGKIWGGELFIGDLNSYQRIGHFEYFKLINSDIANLQNLALSVLWHYGLENEAESFFATIPNVKLKNLSLIYQNSSLTTSSLGRIIDAFGALVFGVSKLSYEAQIGLMCESFYDSKLHFSYDLPFENGKISFKELIQGALKHDKRKAATGLLNGLADLIVRLSKEYDLKVVLSGGVFQNKTLLEILQRKNFNFYVPLKFPCNDSSIALGQMAHFLTLLEKNQTHQFLK